jgi:hypothetical protein
MPQVANSFETYDAVGNRETLADYIAMITPEETPFLSLIGREKVTGIKPEWQTDALAAPNPSNNVPEGNSWSFAATSPTTRVGNYCQISEKTISITNTQEVVAKAGRKSEIARELSKKGVELKIDQEVILLSNQASSAGSGNAATNRTLGAFRAWLASNDDLGSGGASGGFNSSTNVVDAATNGTQRAFTKALLDSTIRTTYVSGGNPRTAMMSPYCKGVFSGFMADSSVAPQRYETPKASQTTIIAAADTYLSDFGTLMVVPNRQMARAGAAYCRNVFLIDATMVSQGVLRPIDQRTPAETSDATQKVLNTEYTLVIKNEAAHGVVADVYGFTSAS